MQQDISKVKYLGTSATLGDPNLKEITEFLFKLFNTNFDNCCVITPSYSEDFKKNILFSPKFYKEIKGHPKLNSNEIRAHSFFCAPPALYRCQSCEKIHFTKLGECDQCKSNLIFEIVTCRQ